MHGVCAILVVDPRFTIISTYPPLIRERFSFVEGLGDLVGGLFGIEVRRLFNF